MIPNVVWMMATDYVVMATAAGLTLGVSVGRRRQRHLRRHGDRMTWKELLFSSSCLASLWGYQQRCCIVVRQKVKVKVMFGGNVNQYLRKIFSGHKNT